MADKVDVLAVGSMFRLIDGTAITLVGVRKVPAFVAGETQTRAGREPVRIRMDDVTVYDCESGGVRFTNNESEMRSLAGAAQ